MHKKKWLLCRGAEIIVVTRRTDVYPEEARASALRLSAADVEKWMSNPNNRQTIFEMHEDVRGAGAAEQLEEGPEEETTARVIDWLAGTLRRRELLAFRVPRRFLGQSPSDSDAKDGETVVTTPPRFDRDARKSWIEIELVDSLGAPVANERFRLELPDGTFYEAMLDGQGRARVSDIDAGLCEINFPDRDASEWRAA